MPAPREPTPVFVVPHTHWDREWYEPAVRFRQRLAAVLDEVLDALDSGVLPVFLLDGQTVLLEDYLVLRPQHAERVRRHARARRLLLGPWYVLADELMPADETLVRNLLAGRADGRRFGHWLDLGYSPDAFGHPAALPTVLAGFGIGCAILWRGYGGEPGQNGDLFRWRGGDGAVVVAHHLPPTGYEFGANLPAVPAAVRARWEAMRRVLEPRAAHRALLLLNGADHQAPQSHLAEALDRLNGQARGYRFGAASPSAYFAALPPDPEVPEVEGELRFSYRYAWTLQGTFATRSRLKQAIAEGERLLLRWAEPQAALAWLAGAPDRRGEIAAAWREHLRNCFHDTLCGSVTDEVADDALRRAGRVATQARGILDDALHDRLGQDRTEARRARGHWSPRLVVVNPSAHERDGVVEATVTVLRRRVVVGRAATPAEGRTAAMPGSIALLGADGVPVPVQVLSRAVGHERLDSSRDYPVQDEVWAHRVALLAKDVPSLGLRAYRVAQRGSRVRVPHPVIGRSSEVVGAWCCVSGAAPGGFTLHDTETGKRWAGLGDVLSEVDEGDTYTFQPVAGDRPVRARWGRVRRGWAGPLVAAIARDFTLGRRAGGTVFARLDAESRLVRFGVQGRNLSGNHRLRLALPLGPAGLHGRTVADMQYGPVFRERRDFDDRQFPREWPVRTAPMHRYVSVPQALTAFARGLSEYELTSDGTLYITLFRAVGDLSRGDLTARPGHAGWPALTPAAQELGAFRAEVAVATETVDAASDASGWDRLERLAEEFQAPLAGRMMRYGIGVPERVDGPRLSGTGLAFKAAKVSEDGESLVLRCVNATAAPVAGEWRVGLPVRRAYRARLDETAAGRVRSSSADGVVPFEAGPREVVTVRVEP